MDKKTNYQDYLDVLKQHGITRLYHFTDRDNLQSIVDNSGLLSWADCEAKGIQIPKPGGDTMSRDLDCRRTHQHYVRASFTLKPPMMFVALREGRITNPVILEISLDAVTLKDTKFSDRNAVKSGARIGGTLDHLKNVHFDTVKQIDHFNLDDDEKEFFQAEVLVKNFIPLSMIMNLDQYGITIPAQPSASSTQSAPVVKLHTPYTAQITRETPTAFIFLVDHSASMSNFTSLYGQDMTCASAV